MQGKPQILQSEEGYNLDLQLYDQSPDLHINNQEGFLTRIEPGSRRESLKHDAQVEIGLMGSPLVKEEAKRQYESDISQDVMLKIGRTAVSIFCNEEKSKETFYNYIRDLGISHSKQPSQSNQLSYENVISGILLDTYYKIETFLNQCRIEVQDLADHFGEESIVKNLLNCKSTFLKPIRRILQDIMQAQWGISSTAVDQSRALKLFEALKEALTKASTLKEGETINTQERAKVENGRILDITSCGDRRDSMKPSKEFRTAKRYSGSKPGASKVGKPRDINRLVGEVEKMKQMSHLWNNGFEERLTTLYQQGNSLTQISEYLMKYYPQYHQLFTTVSLRAKIIRILRTAIYSFEKTCQKNKSKLPVYNNLGQLELRALIYNDDAKQIRKLLLTVYGGYKFDPILTTDTIFGIQNYLSRLHKDVRSNSLKGSLDIRSFLKDIPALREGQLKEDSPDTLGTELQ